MVIRGTHRFRLFLGAFLLLLAACTTANPPAESGPPEAEGETSNPDIIPQPDETQAQLDVLLARAEEELALGHHAVALTLFAETSLRGQGTAPAAKAEERLSALRLALAIEPGAEWMHEAGGRERWTTRDLLGSVAPAPSIVATIAAGPARVAVHGLSVEFVYRSAGSVVGTVRVQTSEFGTASAVSPQDIDPARDLEVEVSPFVTTAAGPYSLAMDPVVFAYAAPASLFGAAGVYTIAGEAAAAPDLIEVAFRHLRPLGTVSTAGSPASPGGAALAEGDRLALGDLAAELDCLLVAVAHIDFRAVSQVEYGGRLYDIWKADAVARFTLYDPVGPRSLYSVSTGEIDGQGGSQRDAIVDTLARAAEQLDRLLWAQNSELRLTVAGLRE